MAELNAGAKEIMGYFEAGKEKAKQYVSKLMAENRIILDDGNHDTNLMHDFHHHKERFASELTDYLTMHMAFGDTAVEEITLDTDTYCFQCGKQLSYKYSFKNNILKVTELECYEAKPVSFEIKITSGKLILCNWPKYGNELINHDIEKDDSNCVKGRDDRSRRYALENIIYFHIGNTCPNVYMKNNLIHIGCNGVHDYLLNGGKHIGTICTDLWAVTAFDYDIYKTLAVAKFGDKSELKLQKMLNDDVIQVQVKPGIYQCTNYYETSAAHKENEPNLFVEIKWLK